MEQAEFDFNAHEPKKNVDLVAFDTLCREIFLQKRRVEDAEEVVSKANAELERLKAEAMKIMKDSGKEKFFVEGMGTIYIHNRYSVTVPKEPSRRQEFFNYLKDKGVFEDIITVNHQTLNSYWKQEWETAGSSPDFEIPGVGQPTLFQTVATRKA